MTTLAELREAWENLAERDALGAILTDPSKVGGRWSLPDFMATGDAEVATVMNHLSSIGCTPARGGIALDFGCGVGRLTQALAREFASCIGIDISKQMIENAMSINKLTNCSYEALAGSSLPFGDGMFSFIYSNIVLQHIPRKYAVGYLREFERVLLPGGILVFGVQDSFSAPNLSSRFVRLRHVLRIRSRVRSAMGRSGGEMQMHCLPEHTVRNALKTIRIVDVQFTNTAAKDFNGRIEYLKQPPAQGYVGKQYCGVKEAPFDALKSPFRG